MDINLLDLFDSEMQDYFKRAMMSMMRSELAICASASSTEEDQKAYIRLVSCLTAEVVFEGSSIKANAGIDESKLTAEFIQKNRGLIDLVNQNFDKKNQFALEEAINDQMDSEDIKERIVRYYVFPYIEQTMQNNIGGEMGA